MSRETIYKDEKLTVVSGVDHALGVFLQIYDKDMENETPEGEGLVYDYSEFFGVEVNHTDIPSITSPQTLAENYIENKNNMKC